MQVTKYKCLDMISTSGLEMDRCKTSQLDPGGAIQMLNRHDRQANGQAPLVQANKQQMPGAGNHLEEEKNPQPTSEKGIMMDTFIVNYKRKIPKILISVACLATCMLSHPIDSLIVVLSETIFFILCADILSHMVLTGNTTLSQRSQKLSLLLIPTFSITLYAAKDKMTFNSTVKKEKFLKIFICLVSISIILLVCKYLRIFSNLVQVRKMLKKSKHHLGPGLARSFFSFLEMLGTSQYNTPGLQNILADYQENEYIDLHPKVFIIFPKNTSQDAGSHAWMFAKEKKYNTPVHLSKHGNVQFTFQGTILHKYFLNGKDRDIELAVIKIKNTETRKIHYVAIAENRPMITLQKMKNLPSLRPPFSEDDFQLQSEIYKKNLADLINKSKACKNLFEIVDMQADNGDFTIKIYNRIVGIS